MQGRNKNMPILRIKYQNKFCEKREQENKENYQKLERNFLEVNNLVPKFEYDR